MNDKPPQVTNLKEAQLLIRPFGGQPGHKGSTLNLTNKAIEQCAQHLLLKTPTVN
jgi:hypothetical protein